MAVLFYVPGISRGGPNDFRWTRALVAKPNGRQVTGFLGGHLIVFRLRCAGHLTIAIGRTVRINDANVNLRKYIRTQCGIPYSYKYTPVIGIRLYPTVLKVLCYFIYSPGKCQYYNEPSIEPGRHNIRCMSSWVCMLYLPVLKSKYTVCIPGYMSWVCSITPTR